MKTLKTNGKELIAVEVPIESTMHWINSLGGFMYYNLGEATEGAGRYEGCEILGTLTDGKADFDVEPYVEKSKRFYKNYQESSYGYVISNFKDAADSFLSLLQSHSIEYANKKLIFLLKK